MSSQEKTPGTFFPPAARLRVGIARRDITPPVGIYNRSWGAAKHDVAEGIHRPFSATVLAMRPALADEPTLLLADIDAGWWQVPEDEWLIRGPLIDQLKLDPAAVMVICSHTHAGASLSRVDADKPGGHLIEPYLLKMRDAVIEASREAISRLGPATLTWATGRCNLATNRDLPDSEKPRMVCGYNPNKPADDTLLVGRITEGNGKVIGTIINYACHPTTLAWDNRLLSPDYVGATRETVERQTGGAPCVFLQGASGEMAPREQYVGDTAIADANGRRLGFAALAALESMLPPGDALQYAGVVESGAPWRRGLVPPMNLRR